MTLKIPFFKKTKTLSLPPNERSANRISQSSGPDIPSKPSSNTTPSENLIHQSSWGRHDEFIPTKRGRYHLLYFNANEGTDKNSTIRAVGSDAVLPGRRMSGDKTTTESK